MHCDKRAVGSESKEQESEDGFTWALVSSVIISRALLLSIEPVSDVCRPPPSDEQPFFFTLDRFFSEHEIFVACGLRLPCLAALIGAQMVDSTAVC